MSAYAGGRTGINNHATGSAAPRTCSAAAIDGVPPNLGRDRGVYIARQAGDPAPHPGQDPAHADALPIQPARRVPLQHRPRPHTLSVTSAGKNRLVNRSRPGGGARDPPPSPAIRLAPPPA